MKLLLLGVAVSAIVAIVLSTDCHHGDLTNCDTINCTLDTLEVGCEHDVCTCVMKAMSCSQIGDCQGMNCKHDESPHCLDGGCTCLKGH